MPGAKDSDVVPYLAGVSSLTNTVGGDCVLGITAAQGLAIGVTGVVCTNPDAEKLRLEQLLRDGLEPRLPRIDIQPIACERASLRAFAKYLTPVVDEQTQHGSSSKDPVPHRPR